MTRSCHGEDNPCQRCTEGIEQEETGETHNCDQPAGKHHRYYHRRGNKRYVKVVYGALVAVVGYVGHKHNGYVCFIVNISRSIGLIYSDPSHHHHIAGLSYAVKGMQMTDERKSLNLTVLFRIRHIILYRRMNMKKNVRMLYLRRIMRSSMRASVLTEP